MTRIDAPLPSAPDVLAPLPYAEDALDPVISARTVALHYGKHHRGYVETLHRLIAGTDLAGRPLAAIVAATAGDAARVAIHDNAAQAWNHAFYWHSLRPGGGGDPPAALRERIEASFGSVDGCRAALAMAAAAQFGSGWVWLVRFGGTLKVLRTGNAESPHAPGVTPLLTLDVWEHAYYLDYQNRRADHVAAVLGKLINWGFAADNLGAATAAPERETQA